MAKDSEVKVPDIGDFKDVPVIEILVQPGDTVSVDTPLIVLETDKATMEVPSTAAGVVRAVTAKVGDRVNRGDVIVTLAADEKVTAPESAAATSASQEPAQAVASQPAAVATPAQSVAAPNTPQLVRVPDIGDFKNVPVIEILVKVGDEVTAEMPLVVLESDKATMEVPSPGPGVVRAISVKLGDRLNKGDALMSLEAAGGVASPAQSVSPPAVQTVAATTQPEPSRPALTSSSVSAPSVTSTPVASDATPTAASPTIRKLAREFGVDLSKVAATGPRGRILREDVERYVRETLSRPATPEPAHNSALAGLLPWPKVDFAKFGEIQRQPLVRLRKISGANLARNWVMIPHVTNFDEADITDLEAFRQQVNREVKAEAPKLTMLAFLIKACVEVLRRYPEYNASLDGEELVLKRYFHIGFAADTPNGLVVPVIRDADQKGLREIARETAELAALARAGKLKPDQMQGGCFTISSLGGIGGTGFTPIINAPEVAILGVTKAEYKPKWDGKQFQPRLMVPLNLSWDHRVIDGASAARFLVTLCSLLQDFRRVCL